jgi:hypothetical protein
MKANNFNELSFIQSFQNQDYNLYELDNETLLINDKGHIIKLYKIRDNEIRISSMNVSLGSFFEPSIKLDIIVSVYDSFKNKEASHLTDDYGLTLLQEDIISYCKANILHTETFSTDLFFQYYLLYKDWVTRYFVNIEDVTDDYVNSKKVMTWDELFTYTQNLAHETHRVYGFLDTYKNHYITMYDDYGNVDILEYKIIDDSRENKNRESNDLVEIVSDFTHIAKIDAPTQLSNYLSAFEFLMNNPTLFDDLDNSSFMNNVDKFEGENNVNHNGIVKIAPLYTEVVFKYQVINHEIKLN